MRLYLALCCLGALEAQKMHITISSKEAIPQSGQHTAEEETPVIKQLLRNYKKVGKFTRMSIPIRFH